MSSFNDFYYSFSPTITNWERENPAFKEAVKITLTAMISSFSILNYVDMDSESEVLGYGISLILLNVGMYFISPVIVIHTIRKKFQTLFDRFYSNLRSYYNISKWLQPEKVI